MSVEEMPAQDRGARKSILVVDDEVLIRLAIADELRGFGFAVLEAANGDQADEILRAHPEISLVLTDVDMPGSLDGVALAHLIRQQRPDIKVMIMSGWPVQQLGTNFVTLRKPFDPAAVARYVKDSIEPPE